MDLGIVIGVAGILITLLLFELQRIKRYPAKLEFSIITLSRVMGRVPDNYKSITLKYQDYSVKNNLVYLEGILMNPRTCDVECPEGSGGICLNLDNDCKWVDVRVKNMSKSVEGSISICGDCPQKAEIQFPILKNGEAILIEGLIETENDSLVFGESAPVKIEHRVRDLSSIPSYRMPPQRIHKNHSLLLFLSGILIALVMGFSQIHNQTSNLKVCDNITNNPVLAQVDEAGNIFVQDKTLLFPFVKGDKISREDFDANYHLDYSFHRDKFLLAEMVIFSCMFILCLIMIFFDRSSVRSANRVQKFIKSLPVSSDSSVDK